MTERNTFHVKFEDKGLDLPTLGNNLYKAHGSEDDELGVSNFPDTLIVATYLDAEIVKTTVRTEIAQMFGAVAFKILDGLP